MISDQYGVLNLGMISNPYMKWTTSSTGVRILQMVSITCIQPDLVLLKCRGLYDKSRGEKRTSCNVMHGLGVGGCDVCSVHG